MRVLLAGGGGAIGIPLTRELVAAGHEVVALSRSARSQEQLTQLGARPVTADVLDGAALRSSLAGVRADAVVHQLTALRRPPVRHRDMTATDELRVVGTRNLVEAAELVGATRFVTQSMVFGYGYDDPTEKVRTEDDRFAPFGRGRFEDHLAAMRSNETQVLGHAGLEGVALRYGLFYGVGAGDEFLVPQLHRRVVPVLRQAAAHSFVYLDDAVSATVAALERGRRGEAYNVVDDEPVSWTDFVAELARAVGAPPPRVVPDRLLAALPYLRAVLRGGTAASNAKARRELGWRPAVPTYRDGALRLAGSHRGRSDRATAS